MRDLKEDLTVFISDFGEAISKAYNEGAIDFIGALKALENYAEYLWEEQNDPKGI